MSDRDEQQLDALATAISALRSYNGNEQAAAVDEAFDAVADLLSDKSKALAKAERERDEAREHAAMADKQRSAAMADFSAALQKMSRERDAAILAHGEAEVRCAEALEMARKLGEALERATALLLEALRVVDVVADGHTFDQMEAAEIAGRIRAGQPAPAKVDDAMVERAAAAWWNLRASRKWAEIPAEWKPFYIDAMRAALVAALEGQT